MVVHPSGERYGPELRRALNDVAQFASDGVPGCAAVSVSLLDDGTAATLSATEHRVLAVDEAQYEQGDGPCLTAMRKQSAVTVQDYATEPRWPDVGRVSLAVGLRSSLSLPLVQGRRTIGGLNMYGSEPAAFDLRSQHAAATYARHAVLVLGYLQQLDRERAAHLREHQVAATLQRSLLPTLPALEGVTCAARYLAGNDHAQVGGDWYDVFALPDGAIGIAIGDVMGHDLAAAAAMGQLRSVLRSYAYESSSPSLVLDRLDRLVQGFDMAEVATAVYGRLTLRPRTAMLLFTNAGHLPPMVRAPDGKVRRLDRGASPLIGALPPGASQRVEATEPLPTGSLLLLYTDGLVERRRQDIDDGIDRLCAALSDLGAGIGPEQVCDALTGELVGSDLHDDVALLAVQVD
jgi:serine phosphatase RsbU (regulator of sigma subunit)